MARESTRTQEPDARFGTDGGGPAGADDAALEEIVRALAAACDGDFSVRLPARRRDVIGDVQARVNELIEQNARMSKELARVARVIGRDGRMTERAALPGVYGEWADSIE